ncbi:hypothetical protein [Thermogemmatispora onikobensis]|uniref:hypothetical protein n=1 Tax=Thermogemmatispora onikobensis TaxID=732234 RepID=UPI00085360FD|nr:hypothetical protein [Thermogemmatispora onikobensis]
MNARTAGRTPPLQRHPLPLLDQQIEGESSGPPAAASLAGCLLLPFPLAADAGPWPGTIRIRLSRILPQGSL